ncbi:MAG: alpha/beta hydrolase [Muribaculaceae bacterium]|nr:alpha/beta hydrolase [Muribaculaceae bacterium]
MEKNIVIDGLNLHYDETGPDGAQPVILMHGWGCNYTTVASIANAINTKMKVYSLDLPGHGKSQEPPEPWGIEKFTQLVEKFMEQMNISNPVLIGHSFGGRISILLSSRRDIKKVVLVDAAGIKPSRSLKYYAKVYSFKTAKKLFPIIFGKKKGEEMINRWRGKAGSADYRNSSPIMRAVMSICVNEDLKHVMPSIKAPTLLIWGEKDTATPLKDAKTMERLIPDAGLVSFEEAGHYSFLDNPGQFRAVIQSFLLKD